MHAQPAFRKQSVRTPAHVKLLSYRQCGINPKMGLGKDWRRCGQDAPARGWLPPIHQQNSSYCSALICADIFFRASSKLPLKMRIFISY